MKAMIYAGIGLFAVASVYGVTDYYNSSKNGELKKLYMEEKKQLHVPEPEEKTTGVFPANNPETAPAIENKTAKAKLKPAKKSKKAKKTIRFENFSRGRIVEPVTADEKMPEKKN